MRRVMAMVVPIVLAGTVSTAGLAADSSFGDGTYLVGTDIQPGTYATQALSGCYWERLSGLSGTSDDVIANDFVGADGQVVVTIAGSDVAFHTEDCGTWAMVGPRSTTTPVTRVGGGGTTAYRDFLVAFLPFIQRAANELPGDPKTLGSFARDWAAGVESMLLDVVPGDCYREVYAAAWREATYWEVIGRLATASKPALLRAFAALYGPGTMMEAFTFELDRAIQQANDACG